MWMLWLDGSSSKICLHLSMIQGYQDFMKSYWWHGIKGDIVKFVVTCLSYEKLKVEQSVTLGYINILGHHQGKSRIIFS